MQRKRLFQLRKLIKTVWKSTKGKEIKSVIRAAAALRYSPRVRADSRREEEDRREAGPTEGPVITAPSSHEGWPPPSPLIWPQHLRSSEINPTQTRTNTCERYAHKLANSLCTSERSACAFSSSEGRLGKRLAWQRKQLHPVDQILSAE